MFCLHISLLVLLMLFVHFGAFFRYEYEDYYNGYVDNKIIHGSNADIKDHPYQVLVKHIRVQSSKLIKTCGGSIITEWLILSTEECLSSKEPGVNKYIHYGSSWAFKDGHIALMHASASVENLKITKMKAPMLLDSVLAKPIELNFNNINVEIGEVTGWNLVNLPNDNIEDQMLKKGNLIVLGFENCLLLNDKVPKRNSLCTVNFNNIGINIGDLGGPLVINNTLVGVASNVYEKTSNINEVFISIAYYKNELQQIIESFN